jgi:hypothetical protein
MKLKFLSLLLLLLLGCNAVSPFQPTPTPLPGWRVLVSDLLIEDGIFPVGWTRIRDWPLDSLSDVTINHVYRSWWGEAADVGKVEQSIWRAFTIADAKALYAELRQSQFGLTRTPNPALPDEINIPYQSPAEIQYQSAVADEYYLACGWSGFPRCVALARYRNYVAEIITDWQTIGPDGRQRDGLTYTEVENVIMAMDAKFSEFLATLPSP